MGINALGYDYFTARYSAFHSYSKNLDDLYVNHNTGAKQCQEHLNRNKIGTANCSIAVPVFGIIHKHIFAIFEY